MDCPVYAHKRWTLHRQSKTRNLSLKKLLNAKKLLVPIANFIQATGQFEHGGNQRAELLSSSELTSERLAQKL